MAEENAALTVELDALDLREAPAKLRRHSGRDPAVITLASDRPAVQARPNMSGAGVARLPISLVSRELSSGRLVSWGDADAPEIALWTLYPSRRLLSARVTAFLEHLKRVFPTGAPEEFAAFAD